MEIKAHLKYLRISPRKVRLVADAIKGSDIKTAKTRLNLLVKRSSNPISKLLDSAVANAQHNFNLKKENLYIGNVIVNEGPSLKRWMPRAQGRATEILKRTAHITVILREREQNLKEEVK
ncbi:MAG: 50S ribosomal protein L22 [bacterium]